MLAHPRVTWVVVEADGSRMLPVKAPGPHEPVIPNGTTLLVPVVGIDALSKPIAEIAHRPERVCAITGLAPEDSLTPAALAHLITAPEGGLKNAASAGRAAVLINKVESAAERALAREVAEQVLYLGYGVIGGCGLGLGYVSPVSTLIRWFPDRRGMAAPIAPVTTFRHQWRP